MCVMTLLLRGCRDSRSSILPICFFASASFSWALRFVYAQLGMLCCVFEMGFSISNKLVILVIGFCVDCIFIENFVEVCCYW